MHYLNTILIILLLFVIPVISQDYDNDPLEDGYIIHNGGGQEILGSTTSSVSLYKYYSEMEIAPWDTVIQILNYNHGYGQGFTDMATSDFDGDSLNEIVKVWIDNDAVQISALKPDPTLLSIDSLAEWQKVIELQKNDPAPTQSSGFYLPEVVLVQAGNFDDDLQMEFVIAYRAADGENGGYVNLTVFDVDDTLGVFEKGSIIDQLITNPPKIELCEDQMYLFDIACADFNGDGIDEILLSGREPANPTGWQLFATIYTYDPESGNLTNQLKQAIYTQPDPLYDIGNFNLTTGHLTSTDKDQAVIGVYQYNPDARINQTDDTVSVTIIPFETNDLLTDIVVGTQVIQKKDTVDIDCMYSRISTMTAYDVNNDGLDELLSAFTVSEYSYPATKTFKIYQMQSGLEFSVWADLDTITDNYHANIGIGDIRLEPEGADPYAEFTLETYHGTSIYQLQYNGEGMFDKTTLLISNSSYPDYSYSGKTEPIAVAECDGDIRLGTPSRFSVTEILQPLVILNAPPIHFDVFDEQIYDICTSYNENVPQFVASYIKESSQLIELETEVNRDWALSVNISGGFSLFGVSVSSYFSQTWGEKFSKIDNTTTKVTVSISVDAIDDDRIYAIVMDYDIWEYPVYANKTVKAHALVVEPHALEYRWFPSKSWSGHSYIPEHEVGNILSYREYPILSNNPLVDEKIKGDYSNSFVLDANSSYDWELQFDDFQSSQSSTTKEYTRDWGASVSGWGAGFSIDGHYHSEEINTQRTAVANGLNLSVHLDGIDPSIGEVGYIVTPYAYWSKNGALVVDYAAKPELAPEGGTPTWWQGYYEDLADPAFILPWRYDPEKGYALEEEAKRYQTKDLQFYPANPEEGDDVTIEARIHNFSLIPTPGLIGVKFYQGDPDAGGTLIENTVGDTVVYTDQAIAARGTETVHFTWTVTGSTEPFSRIYAIIDEENTLVEIHENNNKSWAILNKSSASSIETDRFQKTPVVYKLFQNYPNPFNPSTTIEFSLKKSEFVELNVFNVLGEKVSTIVSKKLNQGNHTYTFDSQNLASGIYYYQLVAGDFREVKKMIVLR
jgi:hypothetical protein